MLSSVEELKAIPCGSQLGSFTGSVRLLPSDKKITVLLLCAGGELFPLTVFKNIAQNALVNACILGNVLKASPLKAQRFSNKFDGKIFFNTPLEYEFVVTNKTKFEVIPAAVKSAQHFDQLCSGGLYQITCTMASAFVHFGDNVFACVVGDTKNKRADLYVNDECLTICASVDHLEPMNRSIVLPKLLETPVKRKSQQSSSQNKKTKDA